MKRKFTLLSISVLLLFSSVADASFYMSRKEAESNTRSHLHFDLGYRWTDANCRPQGYDKANKAYDYHRWVCTWWAGFRRNVTNCKGIYLLTGSSAGRGRYYQSVDYKAGECELG